MTPQSVLRGALACGFVYSALVVLAWVGQRQILFPGAGRGDVAPPAGVRLATYRASDGAEVHTFELGAETPLATRTVVLFHGNGEVIGDDVPFARALIAQGFAVVIVEYRGYGHSRPGTPNEHGLYADAEAALDGLAARGVDASRVILWGTSLGTGVASEMAARGRGAALVLASPFTSLVDAAASHARFLPVRLMMRDRFDTLAKAASIRVPTLVVHGTADEVVPYEMGRKVAEAIPGARLISVQGGHHNDLFAGAGGPFGDVIAFLRAQGSATR